jgi:hypothetical protein
METNKWANYKCWSNGFQSQEGAAKARTLFWAWSHKGYDAKLVGFDTEPELLAYLTANVEAYPAIASIVAAGDPGFYVSKNGTSPYHCAISIG